MIRAGAVIVLAAISAAAQAAELPKEPAVDLGALCEVHGPGFKALGETDICMRIGGRVAAETGFVAGGNGLDGKGRERNDWTSRAEGDVGIETRFETDIGTVRTVIELEAGRLD